jgi:hypothetical protein
MNQWGQLFNLDGLSFLFFVFHFIDLRLSETDICGYAKSREWSLSFAPPQYWLLDMLFRSPRLHVFQEGLRQRTPTGPTHGVSRFIAFARNVPAVVRLAGQKT